MPAMPSQMMVGRPVSSWCIQIIMVTITGTGAMTAGIAIGETNGVTIIDRGFTARDFGVGITGTLVGGFLAL